MKITKILALLYCILFVACNSNQETVLHEIQIQPLKIDVGTISNVDHDSLSVITGLSICSLWDGDSVFLTGRNKLQVHGKKLVLGDKKLAQLFILNDSGKVTAKVGDIGMSQGTFPSLEDFQIDRYNNEILVFSNEKKSLLHYTLDGKYIGENKLPFYGWQFVVLDSSHLAFFLNQNTDNVTGEYNLFITDRKGDIVQRLFSVNLPRKGFDYTGFLEQYDSGALFSEPFSDSIYEIGASQIKRAYLISFGDKALLQKPNKTVSGPIDDFLEFSFLLSPVFSSGQYTVFYFNEARRRKFVVLNKKTGKLIKFTQNDLDVFYGLMGNIIGVSGDKFYSLLDVNYMQSKIKQNPGLLTRIEQIDEKLGVFLKKTGPFRSPTILSFKFNF
jgi:hypothetical protein